MYFRYQQTANVLRIDDAFAHLRRILHNGDLEFEFLYNISQKDMISHAAQGVKVTVFSRNITPKPILGDSHRGFIDTKAIVDNIRTQVVDAKTTQEQRGTFVVASRFSDFTAFINNDVIQQLMAGAPSTSIPSFNKPRLKLTSASDIKQDNNPQPILHRIVNTAAIPNLQNTLTASTTVIPQALMYDMITRQGLDPTHILNLTDRSQPEYDTHGGLSNPQQALEQETDPAARLLNYHLFPTTQDVPATTTDGIPDTDSAYVLETVTDDTLDVPVIIVIPASRMKLEGSDLTSLFVTFDLVNTETSQAVDSITKILDVSRHLQVYNTPKIPPTLKAVPSDTSSHVNLEIKQHDPGATAIQVFKKSIWTSSTEIDDYQLVGTYNVSARDQALLIQVDKPISSAATYRVISQGSQAALGFGFSNIAIKPRHFTPIRAVALTATQVATGIQLEARHLPTNVVAIQFLSWNTTTFDDMYTTVNGDVGFIDDASRSTDLITTIDTAVSPNNIYKYVARLIYDNGDICDFGDATIEFIQPSPGQVDTKVSNLVVSHDVEPNVTFDVVTITVDTDLDAIKHMLEGQNMQQFFVGDIAAQRDQLKNLIAHSIQRVDLSTGKRENFGVLTVSNFDDAALRKNQAIDPLKYGHKYRYEIYPLLRAPETMFDGFQKQAVDAVTKKPFSFFPAKFLHPLTLQRGVVVTTAGANKRYAKDPMTYGAIGSISNVEVSFDSDVASIVEPQVSRFDRYLNILSWKIQGDIDQIDHFLIMKQVHGIRTLVGVAHSEFQYGSCQYFHTISKRDAGIISYVIVPILNDYKVGPAATTNTVLVEAP